MEATLSQATAVKKVPSIPPRRAPPPPPEPPRNPLLRFLLAETGAHHPHQTHSWTRVLWLTGVDYFSTLGYQPGIAFLACGALSPLATTLLVLVTLLGALPTYRQVAARSSSGQGSIAMLEHLLPGWWGKLLVLALLGFAATDFVITMTLSAADAAAHAAENPLLHGLLGEHRMGITLTLLGLLGVVFLMGFTEAIGMAMAVGAPYIALNVVVILRALYEVSTHPNALQAWLNTDTLRMDTTALVLASALAFPKLALGMSGFETGVSVMPLIQGQKEERIASTRKLLSTAAFMMSALLISSSLVTTVLIPAAQFEKGGSANGRALAYLAHELLGHAFGTLYDFVTIAILWFAGASAMAGLLNIIPRYLPRYGMAPRWVLLTRPLILVLVGIAFLVTWVFNADVDAQGGAYATGVLVLMLSAALAVALALGRDAREAADGFRLRLKSLYFWAVTGVFAFTLVDNVVERPDGVIISACFIFAVLTLSGLSRWWRATELRVEELLFADEESERLWSRLNNKQVHLVPIEHQERAGRRSKLKEIQQHYRIEGPVAFLHVTLGDDRSEFTAPCRVRVQQLNDESYLIEVAGAVAIANTIAYVSEQLDPKSLFLGLTGQNPMSQAFKYLLWGEGETGVLVYEILVQYWASTPEEDVRPVIFLMSA
ncbi:MAG: hypothetical protein AB2A00_19415 [Myxococcota bacterium]